MYAVHSGAPIELLKAQGVDWDGSGAEESGFVQPLDARRLTVAADPGTGVSDRGGYAGRRSGVVKQQPRTVAILDLGGSSLEVAAEAPAPGTGLIVDSTPQLIEPPPMVSGGRVLPPTLRKLLGFPEQPSTFGTHPSFPTSRDAPQAQPRHTRTDCSTPQGFVASAVGRLLSEVHHVQPDSTGMERSVLDGSVVRRLSGERDAQPGSAMTATVHFFLAGAAVMVLELHSSVPVLCSYLLADYFQAHACSHQVPVPRYTRAPSPGHTALCLLVW